MYNAQMSVHGNIQIILAVLRSVDSDGIKRGQGPHEIVLKTPSKLGLALVVPWILDQNIQLSSISNW